MIEGLIGLGIARGAVFRLGSGLNLSGCGEAKDDPQKKNRQPEPLKNHSEFLRFGGQTADTPSLNELRPTGAFLVCKTDKQKQNQDPRTSGTCLERYLYLRRVALIIFSSAADQNSEG
jgi:hypothetical protein